MKALKLAALVLLAGGCAKEAELFISYGQFEGLARVLDYPKFNFTEDEKARFKGLISTIPVFVTPRTKLDIVKEDSSDNRILECALVAKADFIISGDEHLLALGKLEGTKIVSPDLFMRESRS